ncbi:MAG: PEP-CTERM sorting domain-containing protein [Akkermansia sp.]
MNTHAESSVTLVEGGGRFETTRNFTGTLAGGAGATLTAKLAGTTQTGTVVKVDASVGSVDLLNTSSVTVTVTDMVIGAGQTVGVYTGDGAPSSSDEGSVTLTKLKVDGTGATLNANLELSAGGTLTLNGTLAMGSTLTLNNGITLSGSLLDSWTDKSNALTLFSGVDGLTVNGNAVSDGVDNGVTASEVFGDSWSNYKLVMTGGTNNANYNVQLMQVSSDTPEPTTATLSLLALMGLAARRRRKAAK